MNAFDFLKSLPRSWLPKSVERGIKEPSNADLKRWLRNRAVVINGVTPLPSDEVGLPISELVFFPNGRRKTTLIMCRKKVPKVHT